MKTYKVIPSPEIFIIGIIVLILPSRIGKWREKISGYR